VWQHSNQLNIPIANSHKINSIVLGDQYDADINPKDNEWVMRKK
jgi:type IV secretory pathway VirB9-like protein